MISACRRSHSRRNRALPGVAGARLEARVAVASAFKISAPTAAARQSPSDARPRRDCRTESSGWAGQELAVSPDVPGGARHRCLSKHDRARSVTHGKLHSLRDARKVVGVTSGLEGLPRAIHQRSRNHRTRIPRRCLAQRTRRLERERSRHESHHWTRTRRGRAGECGVSTDEPNRSGRHVEGVQRGPERGAREQNDVGVSRERAQNLPGLVDDLRCEATRSLSRREQICAHSVRERRRGRKSKRVQCAFEDAGVALGSMKAGDSHAVS